MQALLYDVHGNLPALEAVVADARGAGAERWLLGEEVTLATVMAALPVLASVVATQATRPRTPPAASRAR